MVTYYRGRLIARPLNCNAGGSLRDRIYWSYHICLLYLSLPRTTPNVGALLWKGSPLPTVQDFEPYVQTVGQSSGAYWSTPWSIKAERPVFRLTEWLGPQKLEKWSTSDKQVGYRGTTGCLTQRSYLTREKLVLNISSDILASWSRDTAKVLCEVHRGQVAD